MKYECCHCLSQFEVSKAIDGFEHGYKSGFLCPNCKENIDENRESLLKDFVLIGGSLFIGLMGATGGWYGHLNNGPYWNVMLYAILIAAFFGGLALIKGYLRSKKPIKTRPANQPYS